MVHSIVKLNEFKHYDYIINYGYYHKDYMTRKTIEMYQDYILNTAYLNSEITNNMIDEIMYQYITDLQFRKFVNTSLCEDEEQFFEDFKNIFLNLYAIYRKLFNNQKIENTIHTVGFIALLILMVIVTYNDIIRIFT